MSDTEAVDWQGRGQPEQDEQGMGEEIYYFGCQGEAGHYLWSKYGDRLHDVEKTGIPETITGKMDGGYVPKERKIQQGLAALCHVEGWTVLAFEDFSVDSRPGSNSAFITRGKLSFDQVIERSRQHFPSVWGRLDFEVTIWPGAAP